MSDLRPLGEILINDVLPLLKMTSDEIKKIKSGNLEDDNTDSSDDDGKSSD